MTVNSLSPAFVKINYTSPFGNHVQTIPSVPLITGVVAVPTNVEFQLRGLEIPVEVSDAVIDFVTLQAAMFPPTVNFVDCTVYSQPTPTDVPTPVASFALGIAGSNSADNFGLKATQGTMTMRADDFTLFKLVWLDYVVETWEKISSPAAYTGLSDIVDYVKADASWLASRGGGKPQTFLQLTSTLNEKLRREYNMT